MNHRVTNESHPRNRVPQVSRSFHKGVPLPHFLSAASNLLITTEVFDSHENALAVRVNISDLFMVPCDLSKISSNNRTTSSSETCSGLLWSPVFLYLVGPWNSLLASKTPLFDP